MALNIKTNLLKKSFILITLFFFLSFLAYFDTVFHETVLLNNTFFFLILAGIIYFTSKNIKYTLYIAVLELILGSQGYLFDLKFSPDPDAFRVSLRLGIFVILFFAFIFKIIKDRQIKFFQKNNKTLWQLSLLFASILFFAIGRAYLWHYPLGAIFSDVNNYFFWFYLVLAWQINWQKEDADVLLTLAVSALSFLNLLTFFVFYVFTHLIVEWMLPLYKWIRDARLGEVTRMSMDHSVHRVFIQSHLYLILAFFAGFLLIYFWPEKYKISFKKGHRFFTAFMITSIMAILISQSRSFWLGGIVVFLALLFFLLVFKDFSWKKFFRSINFSFIALFCALLGIASLIFINLPFGLGSSGNLSFLADRANISDAAVSSRWNQLPVLSEAIKKEIILGYGFAKSLTYESDDPRIIHDLSVDGLYTTSSFEWGYLDMWLKFGFLGLIIYAALIFYIFRKIILLYKKNKYWSLIGILSLIFLLTVHIFTPYLNHPLGIALLIFVAVLGKGISKEN